MGNGWGKAPRNASCVQISRFRINGACIFISAFHSRVNRNSTRIGLIGFPVIELERLQISEIAADCAEKHAGARATRNAGPAWSRIGNEDGREGKGNRSCPRKIRVKTIHSPLLSYLTLMSCEMGRDGRGELVTVGGPAFRCRRAQHRSEAWQPASPAWTRHPPVP